MASGALQVILLKLKINHLKFFIDIKIQSKIILKSNLFCDFAETYIFGNFLIKKPDILLIT